MGSQQLQVAADDHQPPKRPFCHRCSKPLRLCLCSRMKSPPLDNPIAVTILQHSLEKHHPLNSARVARLGLKNLAVVPVTDVILTARFTIRPRDPDQKSDLLTNPLRLDGERSDLAPTPVGNCNVEGDLTAGDGNGECGDQNPRKKSKLAKIQAKSLKFDGTEAVFDKYRVACSSNDLIVTIEPTAKPDISWVLGTPIGRALAANGFTVSKLQRKKLPLTKELQDFEEFNLVIPPGSALLFPNGNPAIGLDQVDFKVNHLIVLDGTWAKAQRMYHENPWLKLLPHLKLNPRKESLYSDVRREPKLGCLSTIESIICAFKGLGNDMDGLDEILQVFDSMIGDQRRCKDEKFMAKAVS